MKHFFLNPFHPPFRMSFQYICWILCKYFQGFKYGKIMSLVLSLFVMSTLEVCFFTWLVSRVYLAWCEHTHNISIQKLQLIHSQFLHTNVIFFIRSRLTREQPSGLTWPRSLFCFVLNVSSSLLKTPPEYFIQTEKNYKWHNMK